MDYNPRVMVTRMRRRDSIDAEEANSPSNPSTPTKKKGRLAAKPQLELIDENVQENVPKRSTRKSTAKEMEATEVKALTPSRRSTRIRSNTSLISEIAQTSDSPRARRAMRRNSQVGSDTETPLTPVRQTRKTRRDSTSSVDKINDVHATSKIDEVILEELDSENGLTNINVLRKSPNLSSNKTSNPKSNDTHGETDNIVITTSNEIKNKRKSKSQPTIGNTSLSLEKEVSVKSFEPESGQTLSSQENNDIIISSQIEGSSDEKENLSVSSSNLLKTMSAERKKVRDFFNKSTSNLIDFSIFKTRHRTKSFTPSTKVDNEASFLSDNESAKKRVRNKSLDLKISKSFGDGLNKSKNSSHNSKPVETKMDITQENDKCDVNYTDEMTNNKHDSTITTTTLLLQKQPSDFTMSVLFVSDSNSSIDKNDSNQHINSEDQRVPVVDANYSCEPMDVDETIPGNFSLQVADNSCSSELIINNQNKSSQISSVNSDKDIIENNKSLLNIDRNVIIHGDNTGQSENNINLESPQKKSIEISSNIMKGNIEHSKISSESQTDIAKDNNESKVNSSLNKTESESAEPKNQDLKQSRKFSLSKSDYETNISMKMSSDVVESEDDLKKEWVYEMSTNSVTNDSADKPTGNTIEVEDNDKKSKRISFNKDSLEESVIFNKFPKRKSSVTEDNKNTEKCKIKDISSEDSKNKSFSETSDVIKTADKSCNKKKVKNSISQIETLNNIENSGNENKSTLVLSQIKDASHEASNFSDTPKLLKKHLMSKSLDTPNYAKEKYDKKNISINCLSSSTPLQKPLKKLGLTDCNSGSSLKNKKKLNVSKNSNIVKMRDSESSVMSSDNQSSDSESESNDGGSNMIDDECEEASDDYESGDSRDDEEKEYEENNEILEKGETLDSDEEFSNDTDYEKDSFIVSSEEEDNELLSGSGDDLSMSDNELTMSKKSKKKYNDRKNKEQKKASKEMYEARHGKDKSKQNGSKKKSNGQCIDSSVITTDDEEIVVQPKNKRMRIDSSHDANDINPEINTSETKNKKKTKRLSKSYDEDALNEKEMTICEPIEVENDPLLVQIKQEPKTPQKDLEISTVQIKNKQSIEEVHLDENMSMFKQNDTSDPLQATGMSENDDDSSISENEEIAQNYESMLNKLNSVKPKHVKSHDISLNVDKKVKKNIKAPIFDELNLTQIETKKSKNVNLAETMKDTTSKTEQILLNISKTKQIPSDTESSCNTIDMKLIFPEESNDSDNFNANTSKSNEKNSEPAHEFIPLKKSEGATNISIDNDKSTTIAVGKKKKNRKSTSETILDTKDSDNICFFMDREGNQEDSGIAFNTSRSSIKKKKQKKLSTSDITDIEDVPMETLYSSDKKSKTSLSVETNNDTENADFANEAPLEVSFVKKQKKEKHGLDNAKSKMNEADYISINEDVPVETETLSEKKKKKKHSESAQEDIINTTGDKSVEDLLKHTTKKKKDKHLHNTENLVFQSEVSTNVHKEHSKKKKLNKSSNESFSNQEEQENVTDSQVIQDTSLKINKKKAKESLKVENKESNIDILPTIATEECGKKKKSKKKKSTDESASDCQNLENITDEITKSRKRKFSANASIEVSTLPVEPSKALDDIATGNTKKKRKIERVGEDAAMENTVNDQEIIEQVEGKKVKKNKKAKPEEVLLKVEPEPVTHKSKKRKNIENDNTTHKAKVLKQNSTDKIHVPRLPETVVKQLSDKPRPEKKKHAIATTPFSVEEISKRTPKPSNYLEESVYLNQSPKPKTKKYSIKHVRVLPFIPTVTTSYKGFTTDFKVNVLEENTQSVAQSSFQTNFKSDYLQNKRIKKLGTFEKYKKSINMKISKF